MPSYSRSVLLALCLLSACAAADPSDTALTDPSVSGAFLAGRFAQQQTDMTTAAADFRHALRADPGSEALRESAFGAALMGGAADALELARRLPGNPIATMALGDADAKAGRWRDAAARFASLPQQDATGLLRPLLIAWAEQGAGATDAALDTLRPLLDGSRNRGVFTLHAAMIADLAGRDEVAGPLYRAAILAYGGFNLRLGEVIANWQMRRGQEAEARQTVAAMLASSPDAAIAAPALLHAIGVRPVTSAVDGVAEAYLALGAALRQRDETQLALVILRLGLDMRPDLTAARLLTAEIESANGHDAAALAALAPVRAADPLAALVDLRRAHYAGRDGRMDEAAQTLERLAAQYPANPQPLAALAELQQGQKHYADAAATFGSALARVPEPSERDWALFYEQGTAYDRAHDWPRAEADLRRALALSPDQPLVMNYLGYAWTEQGRNLPEARRLLERAVALRPNEGSIVDSLGWLLLQQGDKAGAVRFLERAVELDSEDSTINGHLGDAYMAAGRRREALIQWRRALILNPDPADTQALLAKVASTEAPAPPAERRAD